MYFAESNCLYKKKIILATFPQILPGLELAVLLLECLKCGQVNVKPCKIGNNANEALKY